jgi:hypothetical protein
MPVATQSTHVKLPPPKGPSLLHFTVELGSRVYEEDLERDAFIDTNPEGLSRALAENPGRFARWATYEVMAQTLAEAVERELALKHAELYTFFEASLASTDEKGKRSKPTVERIKSDILKHKDYRAIQERLAAAVAQHRHLTAARQTMRDRKDSLIAIASNMRAELDAQIRSQVREVRDRLAGRS